MKYKTLESNGLFYPMVKETNFLKILSNPLWWSFWKRIGDHRSLNGVPFGLYEELRYGYLTRQESDEIIELYKKYTY
jgi:hypothetical protein